MRFAIIMGTIILMLFMVTGCGGRDYSGKVEKSGAAAPQEPLLGDAPASDAGPEAVEVRYSEQEDGVLSRDILLKADSTFIITLHGYADKNAGDKTTQQWDTKLKDVQTKAIMEGCSYEIMTRLKNSMPNPSTSKSLAVITVKFASGEETTVRAADQALSPSDFRAIAYTLTEFAKEKVTDTSIKPTAISS
jgi:hypothetical protein